MGLREGPEGLALLLEGTKEEAALRTSDLQTTPEEQLQTFLQYVLDDVLLPPLAAGGDVNFSALGTYLESRCSENVLPVDPSGSQADASTTASSSSGRLGPSAVYLDKASAVGDIRIDETGLESLSNFVSIRASTCVFKARAPVPMNRSPSAE
jgi:hypothetical protein